MSSSLVVSLHFGHHPLCCRDLRMANLIFLLIDSCDRLLSNLFFLPLHYCTQKLFNLISHQRDCRDRLFPNLVFSRIVVIVDGFLVCSFSRLTIVIINLPSPPFTRVGVTTDHRPNRWLRLYHGGLHCSPLRPLVVPFITAQPFSSYRFASAIEKLHKGSVPPGADPQLRLYHRVRAGATTTMLL